MNRVMLDLETYGVSAGCGILSIGAVFFSASEEEWKGPTFYSAINAESVEKHGLRKDPDTMKWWDQQGSAAREVWEQVKTAPPLEDVLADFGVWLKEKYTGKDVQVWGNGADFDNPILSACYAAVGWKQPWGAWSGRCYRTLKGLRPDIKLVRQGTYHNALDDAVSQAEHAVRILKALKS